MKRRFPTLILLAILLAGLTAVSIFLSVTVMAQRKTIDDLCEFALSQVYLNRQLGGVTPNREAFTAVLLQDVYLADMALSGYLPDQRRRELLIFAYSAYEDLQWRQWSRQETSPRFEIPDLDWSSKESLEADFRKFKLRKPSPSAHAGFLWVTPKDGIDGITGASLDVPRISPWPSGKDFEAALKAYRFRPTGIIAQKKTKAQSGSGLDR